MIFTSTDLNSYSLSEKPSLPKKIISEEETISALLPNKNPHNDISGMPGIQKIETNGEISKKKSSSFHSAIDQFLPPFPINNEKIFNALKEEKWRPRQIGERIGKNDIISYSPDFPLNLNHENLKKYPFVVFSNAKRLKTENIVIKEKMPVSITKGYLLQVFTLDKNRIEKFKKTTFDFKDIFSVPPKIRLELPTNETEAMRFFGCPVTSTEIIRDGHYVIVFHPAWKKLFNRKLRVAFSRLFPYFSAKHISKITKLDGFLSNRSGIRLKRGLSLKKVRDIWGGENPLSSIRNKCITYNLSEKEMANILTNFNYKPEGAKFLFPSYMTFLQRMAARNLVPQEFGYKRAIGIEIETVCPISFQNAEKKMPHYVRVVRDGSIRTNNGINPEDINLYGAEFRILINRKFLENCILTVTEKLKRLGCTVNKSCGLHIHIDMREKEATEISDLSLKLLAWLKALHELVPLNRRNNKYCSFEHLRDPHWGAINLGSGRQHQTLEVRLHSSTLNPLKIIQWIKLIEAIIETKKSLIEAPCLDVLKVLNLPKENYAYWEKRHKQLNKELYKEDSSDLSFLGENPFEEE